MAVCVFPGQGSQYKGMGKELFNNFPLLVSEADMILGYSIRNLCLEDPNGQLNYTHYTQPALYVVNAFSYYKKLKENNINTVYAVGHSLGEYNALLAAEVFDFATGLRLVKKRAELMGKVVEGGMNAVIGLKIDVVKAVLEKSNLLDLELANYNSYTQIVISGTKPALNEAKVLFEQLGAKVLPLNVSGAFHSRFMEQAKKDFSEFLSFFTFMAPKFSVLANSDVKNYQTNNIAEKLANQITSTVLWTDTIEYLLSKGESEFIEIGPGTVLTNLIKRIKEKK